MTALVAAPAIPAGGCPTAAAAIAAAGLGPVCQVASGIGGLAGSAVSGLAGAGVDSVLGGLGSWVAAGATWLLDQIGAVIGATTTVDLGASWFSANYQTMAALAATVVVPLLLLGIMQAVYRQDASMLVRSVLVHVPLAMLLTAVAVKLVQLGLAVTDAMSAAVSKGSGLDAGHFMGSVTAALSGPQAAASGSAPAFVLFLGALAVVLGAVLVWIELLLRASAVYVAVLFLPLALASLAWPAIAHWSRRLVDTLVALVLGKFVIVSVLSLAAGALAGGTGSSPSGAGGSGGRGGGFGAVLGGAALLLLAALAPWALFRLLPFVEAGAVGHLEATAQRARQTVTTPVRGLAQVAMRASVARALGSGGAGPGGHGGTGAASAARRAMSAGGAANGAANDAATRVAPGRDPFGDAPDPGPSSAEATGVGTADPPGHAIPSWEINPAATAAANYYLAGGTGPFPGGSGVAEAGSGSGPSAPDGPPAGGAGVAATAGRPGLVQLPRATGAVAPDWLGSDELGPRLVAGPVPPPGRPPVPHRPPDPDG